jgi:preprotein translocase subunit SecD
MWRLSAILALSIAIFFASFAAAEPLLLEIASVQESFDARTKEPVVTFKLKEASGRMYADFTAQNVGRSTELRVDGRVVMKPVIREPILGGSGQISENLSVDQAREVAERLSSGARVEIEVVAD